MSLPLFQSSDQTLNLLQTKWKSEIDPMLKNPLTDGLLIKNIVIINGTNVINHLLSRQMQGWVIVDQDGAASFYRSAPLNASTLTLTSVGACNIALWVF